MAAFSEQANRTMMNENTVPSGFLGNNAAGGLNVFNIGYAGDTISFDIRISDVQLTAPLSGHTWFGGSNKQIEWKRKSSTGTVKLEYSIDGGNSWLQIVDGAQNSGSYTWMGVPYVDSNDCYIRVSLNSNGHWDTNIEPFSIISTLDVPQTLYPANMASEVATNPLFTWQAVTGASGYYMQVADNPEFEPTIISLIDILKRSISCRTKSL
ncbi:MAG: GPI anchored serine-threonine rich family protein [Candidatus Cloacimonetes bacterium]|nr:GPI anchored serine-threonine rich family protein [Candidatus Cloacimonadota bacterium]